MTIPQNPQQVPVETPDELTITLRKIIKVGKGPDALEVTEITLREPLVSEIGQFMKKVKTGDEIAAMVHFISLVSGQLPMVIEQLGARDFTQCQSYLNAFFPKSDFPETGGT